MMDERKTEAGRAVAGKDPGLGHFYVSMCKSGLRILGSIALIVLGFEYEEGFLVFGATMFLIAEFLGIIEEVVD